MQAAVENSQTSTEEVVLIERAKKEPAMFEPLYRKYYPPIFKFVYQRVESKDDAHDIVSQVFLKALNNLKGYEHRGFPFSSWLYRIAFNECISHFKKNQVERVLNIRDEDLQAVFSEMNDDFYEVHIEKLITELSTLPETALNIIEMRFFEKMSFKDIAEIMDMKEANIKMRLYRVLEKLKKSIKGIVNE